MFAQRLNFTQTTKTKGHHYVGLANYTPNFRNFGKRQEEINYVKNAIFTLPLTMSD